MKTLFTLADGAVTVTEDGGKVALNLDASLTVGGGAAAGILSLEGKGSVVLSGKQAFDLGMKLLEMHSPVALVPIEESVATIADAAISAL